jgi:UDP-N-acetylmuramoyl-L-alanyl-D-glutamate--2,6-diaminopimelate ligase
MAAPGEPESESQARHVLGDLATLLARRGSLVDRLGEPFETVPVTGVAMDSRRVMAGDLFVALRGRRADGHDHVAEAVASGAVAALVEHPLPDLALPQLVVRHGRRALALAAAWVHDFPSHALGVVGITGTDGKTTTAWLVRAILEASGRPTGSIGTVEVVAGGRSLGNPDRATTPEAPELQAHLDRMRAAGDRWAVVEATSHGLAQWRTAEVVFDVGVLTNVTHEHLEFHGTQEAYRAAKRLLFEGLGPGPGGKDAGLVGPVLVMARAAVVNIDDQHAPEFVDAARSVGARVIGYGLAPGADVRAVSVRTVASGLDLEVRSPSWQGRVRLPLPGRYNAYNALAALGVAEAIGLDVPAAAEALAVVPAVPGRMQRVDAGQPFAVIIDYAHTPDALAAVLDELGPSARAAGGGLVAVFGSAGERDTSKRPLMGAVAARRCRLVVLTDEDPRGEDRGAILREIAAGAESAGKREGVDLHLVPDRAAAIRLALASARPGDVVLLAGKGHERTIETARGAIDWDEAATALAALTELAGRGG